MLGITVPDAVLILGAGTAILTAYLGTQKGNTARRETPPDPAMAIFSSTMVDTATFRDLVEVLKLLVVAIESGVHANERRARDRQAQLLQDLLERLDR
ncbi:hypothetical protein [Terrihabitans rhizophilus]|jgi:hypothetical protein|uniref:Uncharacterized protein n=1 Tax=Terrihabitans rhizophilus TaxID=3092662 RepID=A0ABU4RQY9_9HYPH|nr:hypothetical protein [Terrihabitans sp. PJ23]MDX6806593.1 hypothetical protein [Terrihabitans sp. PJ23]